MQPMSSYTTPHMSYKIAILSSKGIGDALLTMTMVHQLRQVGASPTLFHESHRLLSPLFPSYTLLPWPCLDAYATYFRAFDRIIFINDNSAKAWQLLYLRKSGKMRNFTCLFPKKDKAYQQFFASKDFLFVSHATLLFNITAFLRWFMPGPPFTSENGIELPSAVAHRRYSHRIVIHPKSTDKKRMWSAKKFISLAKSLKNLGYKPAFLLSGEEKTKWPHSSITAPDFPDLKALAGYIYESGFFIGNDSGMGHLASCVRVPTLTISGNIKRLALWQPAWHPGVLCGCPFPLPNWKGMRLRDNYWQHCISTKRVLKTFLKQWNEQKV